MNFDLVLVSPLTRTIQTCLAATKNVDKTSISDIDFILEEQPDVIIFGTGKNSVTPNRNLVFDLAKKNIGIEAMTTIAASKTYNILISEGRAPVAILLIE